MVMPPAQGAEAPPISAPVVATRGYGGWRLVLLILLILVPALAVIGVVTYLGVKIGPQALAIGLAGAILPVPALVACFLWLDRYQPSPLWLIATCFLWGAGVATSGSLVLESVTAAALDRLNQPDTLLAVVVAPLAEESLKAAFPILLVFVYRRAFSGITDGIVYCGLSATGFAMVENIVYLGQHGWAAESTKGAASGAFAVTATFLLRVPMTGFAHPLFTAMTGIGLGLAARSPRWSVRIAAPLVGLLAAMVLHGAWNLTATLAQSNPYIILYGYFALYMPIFFAMVGFVLWIRSREGRLAERILPGYATAGWFSPPEVVALGTLRRRLSARNWARRVAGDAGQTAMRAYQFAATRLAVLRDGINRGLYPRPADLRKALDEEGRLLAAVNAYRGMFAGRDPHTPPAWWDGRGYQIQFPDGVVRAVRAPQLPVVPVPVPAYAMPVYGMPPAAGPPSTYGIPPAYGMPYGGPR